MSYATRFNSQSRKIMLSLSKFLPKTQRAQALRKPTVYGRSWSNLYGNSFRIRSGKAAPAPKFSKVLALGKLTLSQAERWLDHLGHCSPCFQDFDAIRVRRSRYHRLNWGTVAAAIILLCSVFVIKVLHNKYPSLRAGSHPANSASTSPQASIPPHFSRL